MAWIVASATFLAYLRTLQNGFVHWDDDKYIYENLHIYSLNAIFFKWAFWGFHHASVGNWLPLTLISYALDHALWGAKPMGYHLTNIILHSANAFLVVVLSARLIEAWEKTRDFSSPSFLSGKGKLIAAAATGLLFGLHPLHVESVAWASERKDVLCAFFFLLSIIAYLRYADRIRSAGKPGGFEPWYLLSLFSLVLALMSKPMAVSLPVALLILDWCPLGRIFSLKSFRAVFYEKLPFIALCAGDSALTILAQKKGGAMTSFNQLPFASRVLVAARSLVLYIWKMVLPVNLVPYYPYPKDISFLSPGYLLPVVFVVAVTAFCLLKARRQKIWLACWGYFVISLLPVLGLIQVGRQAMADRYAYLPSLGPFLAAGVAAAWAWKKAEGLKYGKVFRTAGASAALLAVFSMSYLTFRQTGIWKSGLALWNYVIHKEPYASAVVYNNRGYIFEKMGQTEKAIADFNEAIAINPRRARVYTNLGNAYITMGQTEKAIADFDEAIAINPSKADLYNNLGNAYAKLGQTAMAVDCLDKAVSLKPGFSLAYYNLGRVYMGTGRFDLAVAAYEKAIALDPSFFWAYNNLGVVSMKMGNATAALGDFNKAIVLNPGNPMFYMNRGRVYIATGCGGLAAADFRKACEMGDGDGCRALRQTGFKSTGIMGGLF